MDTDPQTLVLPRQFHRLLERCSHGSHRSAGENAQTKSLDNAGIHCFAAPEVVSIDDQEAVNRPLHPRASPWSAAAKSFATSWVIGCASRVQPFTRYSGRRFTS